MSKLKISVAELKALPHNRLDISFKENLSGLEAVKPVVGELTITLGASGVRLVGCVKTLLKLSCDSCLRPYFQAISVDLDEKFVHASHLDEYNEREQKERELQRDDFFEVLPEDGALDIGDVVYQAVTLATPTYRHCGSECPGPPGAPVGSSAERGQPEREARRSSGDDLIDPRWKNLKSLFPNDNKGEDS